MQSNQNRKPIKLNNPNTMLKLYRTATTLFKKDKNYEAINQNLDASLRSSLQQFAKQMLTDLSKNENANEIMTSYSSYIFSLNCLANSYKASSNTKSNDCYSTVKHYVLDLAAVYLIIAKQNNLAYANIQSLTKNHAKDLVKQIRIYYKLSNKK